MAWQQTVHAAEHLLVITGAGISVASGVPTFRGDDPGAVWSESVMEMGTRAFFLREPVRYWQWNQALYGPILAARPNPAHMALARLERHLLGRGRRFTLVTQNIDTLHEDAGSQDVIKIHGTVSRVRCAREGCMNGSPRGSLPSSVVDMASLSAATDRIHLPRCTACGGLLRPHVLWFDEYYTEHHDYRFEEAAAAVASADVLLFVGTSFAVGITDLMLDQALARGAKLISVDPHGVPPHPLVEWVKKPAEAVLPGLSIWPPTGGA